MYETVRELVAAENQIPGVLAGMCALPPPNATPGVVKRYVEGGMVDGMHPELVTQEWGWAYKWADVHLVHFSFDKKLGRLKPKAVMLHGTYEACIDSGLRESDDARALLSAAEWIDKFEATFVTSRRAQDFWGAFANDKSRVHLVNKGIDLDWFQRTNTKADLDGKPSVLYGEVWRGIKHPGHLLYAINELYKKNPEIRLHVWGCADKRDFWQHLINQAGFDAFIGEPHLPGITEYPEHFYNRGDLLVSPVIYGDLSRVQQESMACGCPVISWNTDPYGDDHSYKHARAFDIHDLGDKIMETYGEVLDDRNGVARKCREIAEKYYDIKEEAKQVVSVLRRVANEAR